MSRQPINLISDTESESESDGGMQLDDLDRVDGLPMFHSSEGDGLNVDGIPMPRPGSDDDWDLNGDTSNESDTSMYSPPLVKFNSPPSTMFISTEPYTSLLLCTTISRKFCLNIESIRRNHNLICKLTPQKGRFTGRAQNPLTTSYNDVGQDDTEPQTAFEKDARTRSHLRDEKHAALAVLMDSELLVTYALASREVRYYLDLP
jgi:hypothetical protein